MNRPIPQETFLLRMALVPVHLYRFLLSPFLGNQCRFYPTCSTYMMEAIRQHGVWRGYLLGLARLCRCHPWHRGDSMDPVPERFALPRLLGYKRGALRNSACETDQDTT